jgi:hypothetical protein
MEQKYKWLWVVTAVLFLWAAEGHALEPQKPMPPSFSLETDPADVLHNYPLGVISEQDAFAHHGGPVRKVTLPNGTQGWLYKSGEKEGVPSIYVLEFSSDGLVIDVLHKDYRYKIGHSALQYQYLQHVEAELSTLGPGPGK